VLPPAAARDGDETHNVRTGVEGDMVEQVSNMDAVPALVAVETARAIHVSVAHLTPSLVEAWS
jgi:hypothetical protein